MTPRYGVKYPDGTWSGPITESHRDAARYGRQYHGTVYEVGGSDDPCPRNRPEAEPWGFGGVQMNEDMAFEQAECDRALAAKFGGG